MRSGRLNKKLYIQEVTESTSGGVKVETWAVYATRRCETNPIRGGEYFAAEQIQDKDPVLFRVRYASGVTTKMRVIYGDKVYDIVAVVNIGGLNRELVIATVAYPQEYDHFKYSSVTVADDTAAGTMSFTWTTEVPGSSKITYQVADADDWTTTTEADTAPRVLDHTVSQDGFLASTDYEYKVWSKNGGGWSAGYSDTGTFSTDADKRIV